MSLVLFSTNVHLAVYQDPDADSADPVLAGEERLLEFINVIWKAESEKALRTGKVNDVSEYRMSLTRDDFVVLAKRIDRLLRTTGIRPVAPEDRTTPIEVATPKSSPPLAQESTREGWSLPNGDDEDDASQWLKRLHPLLRETVARF